MGVLAAIDRPWWEWLLISLAGLVLLVVLWFVFLFTVGEWWTNWRARTRYLSDEYLEEQRTDVLAFPYYVDQSGIRSLAAALKIEIPLSRQVTKSRKVSAVFKGMGGESGRSETAEFGGQIDLTRLAASIARTDGTKVAAYLGHVPTVSDREVLAEAVRTIQTHLADASGARDALKQIEQTYEVERSESIVKSKRRNSSRLPQLIS